MARLPVFASKSTRTLNTAKVDASASGDAEIVAAVPGKSIVLGRFFLVTAAAVGVKWRSGATDLSGPLPAGVCGQIDDSDMDSGLLATSPGEALVLNLSDAVQVGGYVTYWT